MKINVTKHLIAYASNKELANQISAKYPDIAILSPDDHEHQADVYLFAKDEDLTPALRKELKENKRSWFVFDQDKNKWYGYDYISTLGKYTDNELMAMAVLDPSLISNISYVLASRGIADEFEIEPTDTEGHSYDIWTTINDKEIVAFSTIWDPMSYERTLVLAYLKKTTQLDRFPRKSA